MTAVLVVVLLLAGCGGDVDADKAEEQIKSGIAAQTKADVKYVNCPQGVNAQKGGTFQCEALIPVTVTQVDENGNVRWQITSFSGAPGGATGTTGVAGATGVTPPGGAVAGSPGVPGAGGTAAPAQGGGAVKDDQRYEKYTNRSQGYSITHPLLWKRVGSGRDVNFPFAAASRFIHVLIHDVKGLPSVSDTRASLKQQPGIQAIVRIKRDTVSGQSVLYAEYVFRAAGARVGSVIKRYVFARGDKRALIELGANEPLAEKKPLLEKFDRAIKSFRWLKSGT